MKLHNYFMSGLLAITLISCGSRTQQGGDSPETQAMSGPATVTVQDAQDHPGKKVYDNYCKACHMSDGKGMKGMHPPLVNNATVNGKPGKLIDITLNGMMGKVTIDGVEYNGIMPPHNHLTDKQIADVLTYVRQNFGNRSGAITVDQVRKQR